MNRPPNNAWQVPHNDGSNADVLLSKELQNFASFMKLTDNDKKLRKTALDQLEKSVQFLYKSAEIVQFGSYPANLSTFLSDIDVSVCIKDTSNSKRASVSVLRSIIQYIRKSPWVIDANLIARAKVPILQIVHRNGVQLDLSVNSADSRGALVVTSLVGRCGPVLRDLSAFLKVYLQQNNMNSPFTGGLGSFALYLMITKHVEMHPGLVRLSSGPELGPLLLSFLSYYSSPENLNKNTILQVSGADPMKLGKILAVVEVRKIFEKAFIVLSGHQQSLARLPTDINPKKVPETTDLSTSALAKLLNVKQLINGRQNCYTDNVELAKKNRMQRIELARTTAAKKTADRIELENANPLDKYLNHMSAVDETSYELGTSEMAPNKAGDSFVNTAKRNKWKVGKDGAREGGTDDTRISLENANPLDKYLNHISAVDETSYTLGTSEMAPNKAGDSFVNTAKKNKWKVGTDGAREGATVTNGQNMKYSRIGEIRPYSILRVVNKVTLSPVPVISRYAMPASNFGMGSYAFNYGYAASKFCNRLLRLRI